MSVLSNSVCYRLCSPKKDFQVTHECGGLPPRYEVNWRSRSSGPFLLLRSWYTQWSVYLSSKSLTLWNKYGIETGSGRSTEWTIVPNNQVSSEPEALRHGENNGESVHSFPNARGSCEHFSFAWHSHGYAWRPIMTREFHFAMLGFNRFE